MLRASAGMVERARTALASVARAAKKPAPKGKKGGATTKKRAKVPEIGINETKYRLHVQTLYPAKEREAPALDFAEQERRAQIAKNWSRYLQRKDHLRLKEEMLLIKSQQRALEALRTLDPQLVEDIKTKTTFEDYAPVERLSAMLTPPTRDPAVDISESST